MGGGKEGLPIQGPKPELEQKRRRRSSPAHSALCTCSGTPQSLTLRPTNPRLRLPPGNIQSPQRPRGSRRSSFLPSPRLKEPQPVQLAKHPVPSLLPDSTSGPAVASPFRFRCRAYLKGAHARQASGVLKPLSRLALWLRALGSWACNDSEAAERGQQRMRGGDGGKSFTPSEE